jgi:hypothetical protein
VTDDFEYQSKSKRARKQEEFANNQEVTEFDAEYNETLNNEDYPTNSMNGKGGRIKLREDLFDLKQKYEILSKCVSKSRQQKDETLTEESSTQPVNLQRCATEK